MNFRNGGFWLGGMWAVGLGYLATMGACGPVSSDVGSLDAGTGDGGADGGEPRECEPGATRRADDGCNTCTCSEEGTWACTEIGCACEDGAMRPAGDGCNQCVCEDGAWSCTEEGCNEVCTLGDTRGDDCNSCVCTDFGQGPTWACTTNVCTECTDGQVKPAGDGCNTCTCVMGGWACTDAACGCTNGDMKPAGDGCNDCFCINGKWGCTLVDCGPPSVCTEGLADCDGDMANGCETDIASSAENCGACGNVCSYAGALGACDNGACAVGECLPGHADCNGEAEDGCEAQVGPGGCGDRCAVPTMMVNPVPAQGTCECPAGTACLRGSLADEDPDSEYCYPIPQGCMNGFASCSCMADCFCPAAGAEMSCHDQMAAGGVFIINCAGQPGM